MLKLQMGARGSELQCFQTDYPILGLLVRDPFVLPVMAQLRQLLRISCLTVEST